MSLCRIDTPLCTQFLCIKIASVKIVPSPDFIQHRLKSAGINPMNLLVDVTNYIAFDLGQPMHVYDADKVQGILRACHPNSGQSLELLDKKTIQLSEKDLVIADDSGPIGLAGIMGGISTSVTDSTSNIILEAAVFDPICIALSGQHHNITSNSRMRFERGIDSAMTQHALQKAADLILTHGGGTIEAQDFQTTPIVKKTISWTPDLMRERTGVELSHDEMKTIFERLGCVVDAQFNVQIPTWRHDLTCPEDLVEELLRIKGYDALPQTSLPPKSYTPKAHTDIDLTHMGLMECVSLSFTTHEKACLFNDQVIELSNPISQELSTLKPSLLAGLLDTTKHNLNYGQDLCAFYETGKSYKQGQEAKMTAGLRCGQYAERSWHTSTRNVDVFDAKADCLEVLKMFGMSEGKMQLTRDIPSYYHPHQAGCFKQGKKVLGYFGSIHPAITKAYDIKKTCVGFEVFLENMPTPVFKTKAYSVSDLPKTQLDLSFIVDLHQESAPLCQLIAKMPMIEDVSVFDIYAGTGIPQDKKAIAIQFKLAPSEKTLTDQEIQTTIQTITDQIEKQYQAKLRSAV